MTAGERPRFIGDPEPDPAPDALAEAQDKLAQAQALLADAAERLKALGYAPPGNEIVAQVRLLDLITMVFGPEGTPTRTDHERRVTTAVTAMVEHKITELSGPKLVVPSAPEGPAGLHVVGRGG